MNLQSIIILSVYLLILLFLIWHFGGKEVFLWNYVGYVKGDTTFYMPTYPKFECICLLLSLPFLLLTFVVYSILPELQNMHGYTLRVHVASLFVTNVTKFCTEKFPIIFSTRNSCLLAYILNFSCLSSLFWLNVICFDTWWTIRQSCSYRTHLKKREKKMFIMYSIYAWGISFILNVVYAILDIPDILITMETELQQCRIKHPFVSYDGKNLVPDRGLVYFYVPVSVSLIINICFFIAVTLKICNHGKQTDNQLRNSRTSHDNKYRFTIYVTLCAVLGISWILKIILWMTESFVFHPRRLLSLFMIWCIAEVIDIFQGVILFFAFVYKKKIKLLLLKRMGWQDHDPDNISRNNNRPSTNSSTVTLSSISPIVSMQEISLSNQQIIHRVESYS